MALLFSYPAKPQQSGTASAPARDTVKVEFSMNDTNSQPSSQHFHQGETVTLRFSISDKVSGTPLSGLHPAAWMELHGEKESAAPVSCKERVQKLLNTNFLSHPELDLNSYYVLVMNDDSTITIMDPQFSYGNPRLVASLPLAGPGTDWKFSVDQKLLFVSMPLSGKLAVIDTKNWQVIRNIDLGPGLGRISLQPDGRRLWAAYGSGPGEGVAAIDVASLQVAGKVETGAGPHEIAFSEDGRQAFIVNTGAGTVSIRDTAK